MESAGDFEPASDGERLDSRLFGIQELGALLMGPRGGVPTRRSPEPAGRACMERWVVRGPLRAKSTLSLLARNQSVRLHG